MIEKLILAACGGGGGAAITFPNEKGLPLVTEVTDMWAISHAD